MSPTGHFSSKNPYKQDNSSVNQTGDSAKEVASASPQQECVEEVRHHKDFSEQIEIDSPPPARVKLPTGQDYQTIGTGVGSEEMMEEGEIEDFEQVDGMSVGEVDLEELLEMEEDGADEEVVLEQVQEELPQSITPAITAEVEQPPQSRGRTRSGLRLITRVSSASPSAPPGINAPDPYLIRIDAWVTPGEYALYQHPRLRQYRVKNVSRLRTCWVPKKESDGSDEEGTDDGTIIL